MDERIENPFEQDCAGRPACVLRPVCIDPEDRAGLSATYATVHGRVAVHKDFSCMLANL
jgi:hypothetical protein